MRSTQKPTLRGHVSDDGEADATRQGRLSVLGSTGPNELIAAGLVAFAQAPTCRGDWSWVVLSALPGCCVVGGGAFVPGV